jgi:hypothetical protein
MLRAMTIDDGASYFMYPQARNDFMVARLLCKIARCTGYPILVKK